MKQTLVSGRVLVFFAVVGLARPMFAAEPSVVGVLAIAVEKDTAAKLGLTPEKVAELQSVIDEREKAALELHAQIKGLNELEQAVKLDEFRRESEKKGLALLDEAQRAKLEQTRLQKAGYE